MVIKKLINKFNNTYLGQWLEIRSINRFMRRYPDDVNYLLKEREVREHNDLVKDAQKFWGKKLNREINDFEAEKIITNTTNFLKFLMSINKEKE